MSQAADKGIALIGGGALALELFEVFDRLTFSACYSDPEFISKARVDLPLFSDVAALRKQAHYFVLGLTDPQDRIRLATQMVEAGLEPASPLIAPTAVISPSASLEAGTVIGHGVQVGSRCRIGAHNLLMHNTVLGHDTTTGRHVIFNPGVYVAGYVSIQNNVTINANATLAKGISVGENAFIAPGAACFRSIPENARAVGNPARIARSG